MVIELHKYFATFSLHCQCLLIFSSYSFPSSLHTVFDSFGKPGAGILEVSLSFLGFYSECLESKAPLPFSQTVSFNLAEKVSEQAPESLFEGKYCLANVQLPNEAIMALQV